MPRIRKQPFGGVSSKLSACFNALLSGASGECLAGELGCCGDSCCSSAAVSRALAEYCQHSDAARKAFVAAKGLEAMQAALTRGSPAVAAAAARVLAALCGCPDGLRRLLSWQRSHPGSDLLSQLAAAAACTRLPPELRAECVEAVRSALGALHGPAAGGGLELAAALQESLGSSGSPATGELQHTATSGLTAAAAAAASTPGQHCSDLLSCVAVPALLAPNAHLRAAAARLVAVAAAEGLLPGGAAAAARTLTAALGLATAAVTSYGSGADGGGGDGRSSAGGDGGNGDATPRRGVRVAALCELTSALLCSGGAQACEVLRAMRVPHHLVCLAGRAYGMLSGGPMAGEEEDEGEEAAAPTEGYGGSSSSSGCYSNTERETLLDGLLLCLRSRPPCSLWGAAGAQRDQDKPDFACGRREQGAGARRSPGGQAGDVGLAAAEAEAAAAEAQRGCKAFTAGVAKLASGMLDAAAAGSGGRRQEYGGIGPTGMYGMSHVDSTALRGVAAELASALADWPQEVFRAPEVAHLAAALLRRLCGGLLDTPLVTCDAGGAAARRVVAATATAAVRLYGALYGSSRGGSEGTHAAAEAGGDEGAGSAMGRGGWYIGYGNSKGSNFDSREEETAEVNAAMARCLLRLLDAANGWIRIQDCSTAVQLLGGPLTALLHPIVQSLLGPLLGRPGNSISGCDSSSSSASINSSERGTEAGCTEPTVSSASSGGFLAATRVAAPAHVEEAAASDGGCLLQSLAEATAALAAGLLRGSTATGGTSPLPTVHGHISYDAWGGDDSYPGCGMVMNANGGSGSRDGSHYGAQCGFLAGPVQPQQPCEALGADEHAALCAALRVWAALMALVPQCTCGTQEEEAMVSAGNQDAAALASLHQNAGCNAGCCNACAVRPTGPLEVVAEMTERLLHSYGRRFPCVGDGCSAQWQRHEDYGEQDYGVYGGADLDSNERSTRLLLMLRHVLTAAVSTAPPEHEYDSSTAGDPNQHRGFKATHARIRCALLQLHGIPDIPDLDQVAQVANWRYDGAPTRSPTNMADATVEVSLSAEDLEEAEAILDDCLACVRNITGAL